MRNIFCLCVPGIGTTLQAPRDGHTCLALLVAVALFGCSLDSSGSVEGTASALSVRTIESLRPASTDVIRVEDDYYVEYTIDDPGGYAPVPGFEGGGCWAPCSSEEIEWAIEWGKAVVHDYSLIVTNNSDRGLMTRYDTSLWCAFRGGQLGGPGVPGAPVYSEGNVRRSSELWIDAWESVRVPLTCTDDGNAWPMEVTADIALYVDDDELWGITGSRGRPLDSWN